MDAFMILEEKIKLLVSHIKKLQADNEQIQKERDAFSIKSEELIIENAKLAEENAGLHAKIKEADRSHAKGNKELEALNKERELTKVAVDDLIKNIDILVSTERQHGNEA